MGEERLSCGTACTKAEKLRFGNRDQPDKQKLFSVGYWEIIAFFFYIYILFLYHRGCFLNKQR